MSWYFKNLLKLNNLLASTIAIGDYEREAIYQQ